MIEKGRRTHKITELLLWMTIISALILTNISFSAVATVFSKQHILILLIFIGSVIVVVLDKIISRKFSFKKRLLIDFSIICSIIFLLYIIYNFINFDYVLFFLPLILALSLSSLVVFHTRWISIGLVVVVCFLLGDVYYGGKVPDKTIFTLPVNFLRVFSLSLVVLFGYYLYKMRDEAVYELSRRNIQLNNIMERLEIRTKELSKLNKRLEELDRLKSEFISTVSHELRTPLTAISNSTQLLKKIYQKMELENENMVELFQIITNNTNRQKNMIENLLNLSRIEKGETEGKRQKINIIEPVRESVDSLRYETESKSIKLKLDIPEELPEVWCIPDQIQRVFINLLSNAIKHSPDNSEIIIKIDKENEMIRSSVKDFGPGISKENLVKVFDKFLQLDISVEKRRGGVGLGLAICKEIVQSHGGGIWVESELGKGSNFIFNIPEDLREQERIKNGDKEKNFSSG